MTLCKTVFMMGLKSQAIAPPSKGRGVQLGLILVALAWEPTGIAQLYIYISVLRIHVFLSGICCPISTYSFLAYCFFMASALQNSCEPLKRNTEAWATVHVQITAVQQNAPAHSYAQTRKP